jgi:hypothetical protein
MMQHVLLYPVVLHSLAASISAIALARLGDGLGFLLAVAAQRAADIVALLELPFGAAADVSLVTASVDQFTLAGCAASRHGLRTSGLKIDADSQSQCQRAGVTAAFSEKDFRPTVPFDFFRGVDAIPERAFLHVGSIDEVREKATKRRMYPETTSLGGEKS